MRLRPPIKCHGGKYYLADWIISEFPRNYEKLCYVEPFVGGGSVLLRKKPSFAEWAIDLNLPIIKVWRAIRDECNELIAQLKGISYCEESFRAARDGDLSKHYLKSAIHTIVKYRMSRGGLGKDFAWSNRNRGGRPGDENAWYTFLIGLPLLSRRIKKVCFRCGNTLHDTALFSSSDNLIYLDPPYLTSTRVSKKVYKFEMTIDHHEELAKLCNEAKAKILISGYRSDEYDEWFRYWRRVEKSIANHSSQQSVKPRKVECLWSNY